jgi:hypothetical protein
MGILEGFPNPSALYGALRPAKPVYANAVARLTGADSLPRVIEKVMLDSRLAAGSSVPDSEALASLHQLTGRRTLPIPS